MEFYNSADFTGGVVHTEVFPQINFNYGSGNIFGSWNDACSATFSFYYITTFDHSFNLTIEGSTNAQMSIGRYLWNATDGSA